MMRLVVIAVTIGLTLAVKTRVAIESYAQPQGTSWHLTASAPEPTARLDLVLMLRHSPESVSRLHQLLMDVSDPHSPNYGKHRSIADLAEVAPISRSSVDAIESFVKSAAPTATMRWNPNYDISSVSLSVIEAAELFETKLGIWEHNETRTRLIRATTGYTVPAELAPLISVVGDLATLPRIALPITGLGDSAVSAWPNACKGLSSCSGKVTPAVLKQRYSVPDDDTGMTAANNSMAVAEFQGQYYKDSDMKAFSDGCSVNVTVDHTIGGNSQSAGVESELDIQYIKGVSPGIPLTVVYASDYSLLKWVEQISSLNDSPLVHSVSYGNDEKQQTSTAYMESCNVQFMKAGIRGISILFASGDQGVCGREGCGVMTKRFKPDFPGGSPYVTAVGGTDFKEAGVIGEETAWGDSGGGFSDTFGIPDWQKSAVANYKSTATLPTASLFNNTGRGYPDIAALGGQVNPYCVVINGAAEGVAGTSASSPTAASIFARLNGIRLSKGKPALGFLNPFIYQNAAAFNDVTSGSNKCRCGFFDQEGFVAAKGWDPVTGLGTPNFAALSKAV